MRRAGVFVALAVVVAIATCGCGRKAKPEPLWSAARVLVIPDRAR